MSPHLIVNAGFLSILIMLVVGCNRTDPTTANRTQEDIFVEEVATVPAASPLVLQHVKNDINNGDVVIVAKRPAEIVADADELGSGASAELARNEARTHMSLANSVNAVELRGQVDDQTHGPDPADRSWLHLDAPPDTILPDVSTHTGNIEIMGKFGNITANVLTNGNITIMGADGDVNLSTALGSIRADIMPAHALTVHANRGNVDLVARWAAVRAGTTEGNVRFVGSLQNSMTHIFTTTAGGSITVAVPAYPVNYPQPVIYRVHAQTSAQPIVIDYPPDRKSDGNPLPICGVIHNAGPYDYHIERAQINFGHIVVTPVVTAPFYFSGTLTTSYYRFDTDRAQLSFFTPRSQAIHIYTAEDLAQIYAGKVPVDADCEKALKDDLNIPSAIVLNLRSGSGRIYFHHIDVQ